MELYIIIILICFIIILYFVDEIKLIYKLFNKNKLINTNNLINKNNLDTLLFLYYNPILLKFYKQLLIELKKINKYDYKSYYTHLNINLLHNELLFYDWFIITYGIIKLGQDTIVKLIKSKQSIPTSLFDKINKLYNYYYFIEKSFKNISISESNKFIRNNKYKNTVLIKLYKIEELVYKLFIKYYKSMNIDKKFNKIIEQSIKNKNINTINSKLNNKFNKKNDSFSNLVLIKFFS